MSGSAAGGPLAQKLKKKEIERKTGIPVHQQRLEYNGKPLKNGHLSDFGVGHYSIVRVLMSLPGGSISGMSLPPIGGDDAGRHRGVVTYGKLTKQKFTKITGESFPVDKKMRIQPFTLTLILDPIYKITCTI
jgi:hypothetical protein